MVKSFIFAMNNLKSINNEEILQQSGRLLPEAAYHNSNNSFAGYLHPTGRKS